MYACLQQTLAQSPDLEMQQRVLMQLGAAGASSDVKDARGETPLMSALVSNNRLGAISLLGEPGTDCCF
jgi:ankyrin repeat protein